MRTVIRLLPRITALALAAAGALPACQFTTRPPTVASAPSGFHPAWTRTATIFAKQSRAYSPDAYRMYFTSNHDENSWQGTEFERMGANHLPSFVLSTTVQSSMPLLYTGQEVSMNKRLRFFEKDTVDWNGPSLASFYRSMFELKHSQPALANGASGGRQVAVTTNGGDRVYVFTRTRDANTVVVAVNFGDSPMIVTYQALSRPGSYTDWFSKFKLLHGAAGTVAVPAHAYRVLVQ